MNLDGKGKATPPKRIVRNSGTTSVGTSATDVASLSMTLVSGREYRFYCLLSLSGSPTDVGFGITGPTATYIAFTERVGTASAFRYRRFTTVADADAGGTDVVGTWAIIEGIYKPSADGTLKIRGIRTGTSLTVDANGYLAVEQF